MKVEISLNTLGACLTILGMVCTIADAEPSEFRPASPEQIPGILELISAQARSNYERIHTWQGEVNVIRYTVYEGAEAQRIFKAHTDATGMTPEKVLESTEAKIQFRADIKAGLLYSRTDQEKPAQYRNFETGKALGTKSTPGYMISIVTAEFFLHLSSNKSDDDGSARRVAFKEQAPKKCSPCELPSVFDPRTLFGIPEHIWELFAQILKYIGEHGEYSVDGYTLKVEQCIENDSTTYRVRIPRKPSGQNNIFTTVTFSSVKGYNPILVEFTDVQGTRVQEATLDYDLIGGIFVPCRTTFQRFVGKDGQAYYEKNATFKNLRINKPIPSSTFTYKNLGLENDDILIDLIAGKEYIYRNDQLISGGNQR